jgi:hypothetical protein
MPWPLPIPQLVLAGIVALLPLVMVVRRPAPRLVAEVFAVTLLDSAVVWASRILLGLLEQYG